jgi:hypothetical protein
MRVVIPYTARHPDTVAGAPSNAEWFDVSEDRYAYWRMMCEVWADGEGFLVVEHDVVCRPDILVQIEACPEPWCAFPYDDMCHWECMEAWSNTLGCTRFATELVRAVPDAVTAIYDQQRQWLNLCDYIGANLRRVGYTHHWHFPAVRHHHMRLAHLEV